MLRVLRRTNTLYAIFTHSPGTDTAPSAFHLSGISVMFLPTSTEDVILSEGVGRYCRERVFRVVTKASANGISSLRLSYLDTPQHLAPAQTGSTAAQTCNYLPFHCPPLLYVPITSASPSG
uniref:Uncharacterized protein n=1 Tax=Knipowitschia caucasica TaxID=637954 RepID=A0AAV2KUX4_KNICA